MRAKFEALVVSEVKKKNPEAKRTNYFLVQDGIPFRVSSEPELEVGKKYRFDAVIFPDKTKAGYLVVLVDKAQKVEGV